MSQNLKAKIEERKKALSATFLAKKLGISRSHLYNLLTGRRKMSDQMKKDIKKIISGRKK